MRVIVAGGGIGGLATALSLHAVGLDPIVLESAPEVKPLGVGINLLPHAVRELTELGLADALAGIAIPTRELIYANRFGQVIWREDRGVHAGYRWPQYSIHRGELQVLLARVAVERLGAARVRSGARVVDFSQDGRGVVARLADGTEVSGDALIGADGIHSTLRVHYHPNEGPPKWNGAILWRATSEVAPFLTGRSMVMAGHQDQKFVCYPISARHEREGRALVNWIAEIRVPPGDWPREDWNRPGKVSDFLPAFEDWNFGWLDVPALIRATKAVFEFPMVDRDPLPAWGEGRVTLLGDAAHPMYPIGSNGASQAIVDARVLAWHLATAGDVESALAAYAAERRPATAAIVLANRRNGPERVMQMVHERAPKGFVKLEDAMSREDLEAAAKEYKLVAGFDAPTLNARASWTPAQEGAALLHHPPGASVPPDPR